MTEPVSMIRGDPSSLMDLTRSELVELYDHYRNTSNELLRRAIIDHNRIDILATVVLGYQVEPLHLLMVQFQFQHPNNLQLAFRGAGKTTVCTVAKTIHLLLKDPDLRILLASKTSGQSQAFLKEVKAHFESNTLLAEIFGEYYDPREVTKWDTQEIEVLPRTRKTKEASVTCVGVEGAVVGKHYDVIIADDLVDEDNSRTKYMRDRLRTWYYQTLLPCLEPPDPEVPHRGEFHRLGTRYHYDDLYGHFKDNELSTHVQEIPAVDDNFNSAWPEKYSPTWLRAKLEDEMGTILFDAQYRCNTESMKGEVFQYDDCQQIEDDDIPKELKIFQGTDLAISQKETADQFASVMIGVDRSGNIYVLDYFLGRLRFPAQLDKAEEMYVNHDPIRAGVESNQYQLAFVHAMKDRNVDYRFVPVHTDKDKVTRAWKLASVFEGKRVFFRKNMSKLIDQFVLFPNHRYKDGFDAFDIAYRCSRRRRPKRMRTREPGVI